MTRDLRPLTFAVPVTHVYNPLEYAFAPHRAYLERFGQVHCPVILLGMNPGPWGMAQTGVPFGEIKLVREWMGIEAPVGRPAHEHPKRPILGFGCPRSEVSGARLWGWAKARFGTPEQFFKRFFVLNYCPLVFMEESGKNRTPDKLPTHERADLFAICDRALRASVQIIQPRWVVGVGAFAQTRAEQALSGLNLRIGRVLHPSPASPQANRDWADRAEQDLTALGVQIHG